MHVPSKLALVRELRVAIRKQTARQRRRKVCKYKVVQCVRVQDLVDMEGQRVQRKEVACRLYECLKPRDRREERI